MNPIVLSKRGLNPSIMPPRRSDLWRSHQNIPARTRTAREFGLDLGEQTLNAKGAGFHGVMVLSRAAFVLSRVSAPVFWREYSSLSATGAKDHLPVIYDNPALAESFLSSAL
jgi:hypothetical protein